MKTVLVIAGAAVAIVGGVSVVLFGDRLQAKPSPELQKIAATHEYIRGKLKDPESAQFSGDLTGERVVCGKVNAKNEFGGYTGAKMYAVPVQGVTTYYGTDAVFLEDDPVKFNELAKGCPGQVTLSAADIATLKGHGN